MMNWKEKVLHECENKNHNKMDGFAVGLSTGYDHPPVSHLKFNVQEERRAGRLVRIPGAYNDRMRVE
jgi:hypothetical protein